VKGYIRIGGSLTLGIAVILGALYVRAHTDASPSGETAVVAATPTRTYIEATDSDGDGIKDWEETLQARVFESIQTPTSTPTANAEPYVAPTTLTGKFSEAFLKGYLDDKMALDETEDPLSDEGKAAFVNSAVAATEDQSQSKRYTQLEIIIEENDSPEALHAYGNTIAQIIMNHPVTRAEESETYILQKALETNDPSLLSALTPIKETYGAMVRDTRTVPTPKQLVRVHLELLNGYQAILTDIEAMQLAFVDPLYGLARINQYKGDALSTLHALEGIVSILSEHDVVYTQSEPGSFLYLFGE
jgi:hypothetical protein